MPGVVDTVEQDMEDDLGQLSIRSDISDKTKYITLAQQILWLQMGALGSGYDEAPIQVLIEDRLLGLEHFLTLANIESAQVQARNTSTPNIVVSPAAPAASPKAPEDTDMAPPTDDIQLWDDDESGNPDAMDVDADADAHIDDIIDESNSEGIRNPTASSSIDRLTPSSPIPRPSPSDDTTLASSSKRPRPSSEESAASKTEDIGPSEDHPSDKDYVLMTKPTCRVQC
ncbi:hypothetical protein BC834DRAFT_972165 [Gloeopeniophorella convolvens]|nr:hypothetical protein BC834DRAFT_972165 [Gloeopeniophorella convolvens]